MAEEGSRERFSRLGALMAIVGSAVGLGNIWRFPYQIGENGGAAFIVIYIGAMLVLCLPMMLCEFVIGRRGGSAPIEAFGKLAPSSPWKYAGYLYAVIPFIILSYYSVVGGWSLEYFFRAVTGFFTSDTTQEQTTEFFRAFSSSPSRPLVCHTIFMLTTALVVSRGVKKGIEAVSKALMPVLFFIMLAIAIYSIFLPGSGAGFEYIFKPDFSKVNGKTFANAIGQAFFSLSLGAGVMLTYASYFKKKENLQTIAVQTSFSDLGFALIAGCAVLPALFSFGLSPQQGPGLVFCTLPVLFAKMPLGVVISIAFFLCLIIAALTSIVSTFEVVVASLMEHFRIPSRKKASWIIFVAGWLVGTLCCLSFGPLQDFTIFGYTIFNFFDTFTANVLLPLGGLVAVLMVGWKMDKDVFYSEYTNDGAGSLNCKLFPFVRFLVRYVCPLVMVGLFLIQCFFHS